mmetsp:Transcript_80695/g.233378  ORF Transcript_80695/g.233378 Transcript_80695/m.233378 type:complete len:220 (-) Transcript_80695:617-1276(-)
MANAISSASKLAAAKARRPPRRPGRQRAPSRQRCKAWPKRQAVLSDTAMFDNMHNCQTQTKLMPQAAGDDAGNKNSVSASRANAPAEAAAHNKQISAAHAARACCNRHNGAADEAQSSSAAPQASAPALPAPIPGDTSSKASLTPATAPATPSILRQPGGVGGGETNCEDQGGGKGRGTRPLSPAAEQAPPFSAPGVAAAAGDFERSPSWANPTATSPG